MNYIPKPLDATRVTLPTELAALAEQLAQNTHEVWAQQRMKDGWTWGPNRDDEAKHHPGLVPYDELSESEKDYDRVVSSGVVKAILALGYRIEPPPQ